MELHEQFFIGLCSKRTKLMVQHKRQNFDETRMNVTTSKVQVVKHGTRKFQNIAMWASALYRPENEWLVPKIWEWHRGIVFWHKGTKMQCGLNFHPEKGIPIIWCDDEYKRMLPMTLHRTICEVFNLSTILNVFFRMNRVAEFPDTDYVDNIFDNTFDADPQEYCDFYEKLEIRNAVKILSSSTSALSPDHRFFSTPHFVYSGYRNIKKEHLLNFQGKSFEFYNTNSISTDDVIDIVKNWKEGTKLVKLESMLITLALGKPEFDKEKFWKHFEGLPWNPNKRGPRFKYPSTMKSAHKFDILDCTQHLDIQRDSDGLLANLLFQEKYFGIFVWHTAFPNSSETVSESYTPAVRPVQRPNYPVRHPEKLWLIGDVDL